MIYHVTCNTDDNYAQHCCAMLCSLFENNKEYDFHIHILTYKLSKGNTDEINRLCERYHCQCSIYEVDEKRLEGVKLRKKRPLTKAAYYRILLPEILDETIEKILYVDCDIIILDRIVDIFGVNIEKYALAACIDACPYSSVHRNQLGLSMTDYAFCSGLMLINLKYWRAQRAVEKLLEFSKKDRNPVFLHDQDSLNYVFKNQWLVLPPRWNRGVMSFFQIQPGERQFDFEEYDATPKLIHYASNFAKPWYDVSFPERGYYLKYLKLSGFSDIKFLQRTFRQKLVVYKAALVYYANKYLRPFIPNFIELIIKDVIDLVIMLCLLVFNHSKLKKKMLTKRLSKYHQ